VVCEAGERRRPRHQEVIMAKVIHCTDGYVVRGDTDNELLANAEQHIREAHPDLAGTVTGEQLLAQAVEE
jgi:predicted small metal-binding protein